MLNFLTIKTEDVSEEPPPVKTECLNDEIRPIKTENNYPEEPPAGTSPVEADPDTPVIDQRRQLKAEPEIQPEVLSPPPMKRERLTVPSEEEQRRYLESHLAVESSVRDDPCEFKVKVEVKQEEE